MLAHKFTEQTPLPQPGSFGYLRGTADKVRVIRRNRANPHAADPADAEPSCLVQLYHRPRGFGDWEPVPGSSGNRVVPEADLYPTQQLARFCGKPPKGRVNRRRGGRA